MVKKKNFPQPQEPIVKIYRYKSKTLFWMKYHEALSYFDVIQFSFLDTIGVVSKEVGAFQKSFEILEIETDKYFKWRKKK